MKCLVRNTRNVLLRTQGMSCVEHTECLAPNTRNVLLRTQGMSCFQRTECPASNTRNVLQRLASIDSSCIVSSFMFIMLHPPTTRRQMTACGGLFDPQLCLRKHSFCSFNTNRLKMYFKTLQLLYLLILAQTLWNEFPILGIAFNIPPFAMNRSKRNNEGWHLLSWH